MRTILRFLIAAHSVYLVACGPGGDTLNDSAESDDVEQLDTVERELELSGRSPLELDLRGLRPGDRLADRGISVRIPPRGMRVSMTVELEGGGHRTLEVFTSEDGQVSGSAPESLGSAGTSAASPGPCEDGAFSQMGHRWLRPYQWAFVASSAPTSNNLSALEQRLREGANNITNAANSCALADTIPATHVYLGRTEGFTNIRATTTAIECTASDGKSLLKFGTLPPGTLGVACVWSTGSGEALESDHKYNKSSVRWFASENPPSGCSVHYSMEGIATHEFGHTFGLGHVPEDAHAALTMSTNNGPCDTSAKTLGLGDWRGLDSLY